MKLSIPSLRKLRNPRERIPGGTLALPLIFFFYHLAGSVPLFLFDPAVGNPTTWYGKVAHSKSVCLGVPRWPRDLDFRLAHFQSSKVPWLVPGSQP